jgi:hypothetical protein
VSRLPATPFKDSLGALFIFYTKRFAVVISEIELGKVAV